MPVPILFFWGKYRRPGADIVPIYRVPISRIQRVSWVWLALVRCQKPDVLALGKWAAEEAKTDISGSSGFWADSGNVLGDLKLGDLKGPILLLMYAIVNQMVAPRPPHILAYSTSPRDPVENAPEWSQNGHF